MWHVTSDYVKRIRAKIGHDLLLLPAVAVLVRDDHGRLLLVRQSDASGWATVGGMVEPLEGPEDAARREASEEIGVDVDVTLFGCFGGPDFVATYPNGDECAIVSTVYNATIVRGSPTPDLDEVLEVGWFTEAELRDLPLTPFNDALLRTIGLIPTHQSD